MTVSDLERLFAQESLKAADVEAFQKKLSRARLNLKRQMDEIEMGNEETYE